MPQAFLKCVRDGGKVTTISMPGGKYVHKCVIKGKTFYGHVHKKKEKKK